MSLTDSGEFSKAGQKLGAGLHISNQQRAREKLASKASPHPSLQPERSPMI